MHAFLENQKNEMLAYWRSIGVEKPAPPLEKFVVLEGRGNIYSRILQMVEKAEKEFLAVTTSLGVIRADQAGLIEAIEKRNIRFRILTHFSKENLEIIKRIVEKISTTHLNMEGRHVNLASRLFPRFVIKDEEEALFFHNAERRFVYYQSRGYRFMD